MSCHGGFNLDEATRRSWYSPENILRNLRSAMLFADVGCGDGFFSILAAKKVGEKGKVYSLDSDASAIDKLKRKASLERLDNVEAKVGFAEATVFCEKCVDMVFYSMVLHDFSDPVKVLMNAKQMVKPNGHLVDLDWKKLNMPFGPPYQIRFSEQHASDLIKKAGFQIESIKNAGHYHYVVTAKPMI